MITSKGVAAVPSSSLVALTATYKTYTKLPVNSISIVLGIDFFDNAIRTVTNMIGNGCAAFFTGKATGMLDYEELQKHDLTIKNFKP
jgi:aerobic C4-dicarboxylate transport protein